MEGDTPSFLYILPNGLHQTDHPEQAGWGGCFVRDLCRDSLTWAWTNWREPQKSISASYERHFYQDIFHDFVARMDWASKGEGFHNPVAIINGRRGVDPIYIKANAGQEITLDASKSFSLDNVSLSYKWWIQEDLSLLSDKISLEQKGEKAILRLPHLIESGTIHIICEVRQDSQPSLVSYRRIIINNT